MKCDDVRDSLEMYISGDLPDAQSRDVAAHLAGCASCTEQYERVRDLVASMRELADAFVPVERFAPAPTRQMTVGWGWRLATAAALALALVALGALSVPAIARQLPLPVTSRLDRLESENAALRKQVDVCSIR